MRALGTAVALIFAAFITIGVIHDAKHGQFNPTGLTMIAGALAAAWLCSGLADEGRPRRKPKSGKERDKQPVGRS